MLRNILIALVVSVTVVGGCVATRSAPELVDTVLTLKTATGRAVELRVLLPRDCQSCPLIVFSHGANAAYDRYDNYVKPLARKGYKIAVPNHVDSEDHTHRSDFAPQDWTPMRLEDYELIVAHFKPEVHIGVGHSFGALIAQIAAGARLGGQSATLSIDQGFRPHSIIALSPPGPITGYTEQQGWAQISVPMLTVTGTADVVPKIANKWQDHLGSYEAVKKGLGYALVYADMDHYMNGAYGRETAENTALREQSMQHLVEASDHFIQATLASPRHVYDWQSVSEGFVKAHSNADTKQLPGSFYAPK